MVKVFIYKEYDLLKELQTLIDTYYTMKLNDYAAYFALKKDLKKIVKILEEAAEVTLDG